MKDFVAQIKDICKEHLGNERFYVIEHGLTDSDSKLVAEYFNVPLSAKVIAVILTNIKVFGRKSEFKITPKDCGIAICDTGIFWKNDSADKDVPPFDFVTYNELKTLILKTGFMGSSFDNGKKLPTYGMDMPVKMFKKLILDLTDFAVKNSFELSETEEKHFDLNLDFSNNLIAEQVYEVCKKYEAHKGVFLVGRNISAEMGEDICRTIRVPEYSQLVAYINFGGKKSDSYTRFTPKDHGIAVCDTGIFWKNSGIDPNAPMYDSIPYSELKYLSFKATPFTSSFTNNKKIDTEAMGMSPKALSELIDDLIILSEANAIEVKESVPILDYAEYFKAITEEVKKRLTTGKIRKHYDFYYIESNIGCSMSTIKDVLPFLRRPENEAQIDKFLDYYEGKTDVLESDEFPVFGYAAGTFGSRKKGWICTNKRIYRPKGLITGLPSIIQLANIKECKSTEEKGYMELVYGFIASDRIEIPAVRDDFLSKAHTSLFKELLEIFNLLNATQTF